MSENEILRSTFLACRENGGIVEFASLAFVDADFAGVVRGLPPLPKLQKLSLIDTQVGDRGVKALAHAAEGQGFPQLQRLWLSKTRVGDHGVEALARAAVARGFLQLQKLLLNETRVGDQGVQALARAAVAQGFPQLQRLWLNETRVGDHGVEALAHAAEVQGFPQLHELRFSKTQVGDRGVEALARAVEAQGFLQLQRLLLSETRVGDHGVEALARAAKAQGFPQLQRLWLNDTQVGDQGVEALARAVETHCFPQLIELRLSRTRVGDQGVESLARAVEAQGFPQLKELWLSETQVGDQGAEALARAAKAQGFLQLQELWLNGTQVGDRGVEALARAAAEQGLPQLKGLFLDGAQIGDRGVEALARAAKAQGFLQLQELWLNDTQVGEHGAEALARAAEAHGFPQLQEVSLHNTPAMVGFPMSVIDRKTPREALREWLRWREAQRTGRPLNECRVLFVGESQVGKTSLCSALREYPIPRNQSSTWGIDIHRSSIEEEIDGRKHTLHLWDFGGQHVMHATHRHYFSEGCLYLLVLDATRKVEGDSLELLEPQEKHPEASNRVSYWLQLIRRYGASSPVLIVQTKADGKKRLQLPSFSDLRKKYGVNLLGNKPIVVSCPPGPAKLTSAARAAFLEQIRAALSVDKSNKKIDEFRSQVHYKWHQYYFDVRQDIFKKLKKSGRVGRTFYERQCEVRRVPEDDRDDLLTRLHRLGELLHYRDAAASEIQNTIYEVEWINRAIYDLLFLKDVAEPMSAAIVKARVEAQPSRANTPSLSVEAWEHVLLVLQQFEVCWVVPDEKGRRRFVIPAACPKMPRSVSHHWNAVWAQTARIECGFEADGLLHRLVARLANSVDEVESYRDGAILSLNDCGEVGLRVDPAGESFRIAVRGNRALQDLIRLQLNQLWPQIGLPTSQLPQEWQAIADETRRLGNTAQPRRATPVHRRPKERKRRHRSSPSKHPPGKTNAKFASAVVIRQAIKEVLNKDGLGSDDTKRLIPHRGTLGKWPVRDNGVSGRGRRLSVNDVLKEYGRFYKAEAKENEDEDEDNLQSVNDILRSIGDRLLGILSERGEL